VLVLFWKSDQATRNWPGRVDSHGRIVLEVRRVGVHQELRSLAPQRRVEALRVDIEHVLLEQALPGDDELPVRAHGDPSVLLGFRSCRC
jgi:hypothetical protein